MPNIGGLGAHFGRLGASGGGVPGWVLARYGKTGVLPSLAADFVNNQYWDARFGSQTIDEMLAITRTTAEYGVDSSGNWTQFVSSATSQAGAFARTNLGLNAWEARTNSIRNNSMQGGGAGVAPTNWSIGGSIATMTETVVGTGVLANGIEYVDVRLVGTPNATNASTLVFIEGNGQIAALNGQTWTGSAFFSLQAGSMSGLTSLAMRVRYNDGSQVQLTTQDVSLLGISATPTRLSNTFTAANASTAFVNETILVGYTNGVPVDFTLRIGWPQLELGASVTPPIRTTSAAATRNADVIALRNALTFGAAYSMYGKGTPQSPITYANSQIITQFDDGSGANRSFIRRRATDGAADSGWVVGNAETDVTGGVWTQGVSGKVAASGVSGAQSLSFNGAAVITGANPIVSGGTLTGTRFGGNGLGGAYFNGTLEELAIWPTTRAPNAQLQAVTA